MLRLQHIHTFYGPIQVVKDISFEMQKGSVVSILGNNGAGKSSLLNTIMRLIPTQPQSGEIYFSDQRIDRKTTEAIVKAGIGYVPEGREIFPELSVLENLKVGAYLRKDRKSIRQDLDRMYGYFPILKERQQQLAGTLSGGEQQMLAISRALMNRPKLLLLDEPSLGLSPLLVTEIFEILRIIHEEGVSLLLVEQHVQKALELADFGYVMENGAFVSSGTAESLRKDAKIQQIYLGEG